jgi:serine phosphatase RsbU (regulator of sigma subunit)
LYQELEHSNASLSRRVDQLTTVCRMLEEQSAVIQEDLARAEVIQRALLPRKPPRLDGWSLETLYRPGRFVGGDLYDIIPFNERHLGIVIADAAGHGVAAAMLSVLFKHRLAVWDRAAGAPLEPCEVLSRANAELCSDASTPGSFITAAYLLMDRVSGEARVAAAGHPPALWIRAGEGRLLDRTGPALGLTPAARYTQETFTLEPGDRLLLYTDGLLDGGPASPTHPQLISALAEPDGDRAELLRAFHEAATRDASHDPDDITIILLERREGPSQFDDTTGAAKAQPMAAASAQLRLLQGVSNGCGFVSIAGTGTWMRSQAFFDAVSALMRRHGRVTVDLRDCDHLDSTFLGTIYELVVTHPDGIRIQRVPARLKALFDELSMDAALDRITPDPRPLPATMEPLDDVSADANRQGLRLLKAHEILASLSDENQEQFQDVVTSLRQDLDAVRRAR